METMENSDLIFKEKYLKYKKNYLILKEQTSGKKHKKSFLSKMFSLPKISPHYFVMYIILDKSTYDVVNKMVKEQKLSVRHIEKEITGSALRIYEYHNHIEFINAPETSTDIFTDMADHKHRLTGEMMGVISPEYRLINDNDDPTVVLGKLEDKYKFGMIYNDETFITNINSIISSKLKKKKDPYDPLLPYNDIAVGSNFHGIMVFKYNRTQCRFIEAYTLNGSTLTIDAIKNQYYNKPIRVVVPAAAAAASTNQT